MRLTDLQLRSAPGIREAITLAVPGAGLVLLVGPNASGKSTIGRTLRGTLWPTQAPPGVDARSTWIGPEGERQQATLVFGRVEWSGPPPAVPGELAGACQLTLRDLLRHDAPSDQVIAQQIRTQLTGGYDLSVVEPIVKPARRPGRTASRALRDANRALDAQLGAADDLARDEARLAALEAEAEAAGAAPEERAHVKQAMARVELLARLAEGREALAAMPAGLDRMPAGAEERAAELEADLERARQNLEDREAEAQRCAAKVQALALPGATDHSQLVELRDRAQAAKDDAAQRDEAAQDLERVRARVADCARAVWAEPEKGTPPTSRDLERLSERTLAFAEAKAHLAGCPAPAPVAQTLSEVEAQRDGLVGQRERLLDWMAAPRAAEDAGGPSARPGWIAPAGLAGVALLLVGLGWAAAGGAGPAWGLAVVGGALLGAALGGGWVHRAAAARRGAASTQGPQRLLTLQAEYATRGPELPRWDREAVAARLAEIEAELRESERLRRKIQDAERAQQAHAAAAEGLRHAQAQRDALIAQLGLNPDLPGLALNQQADRLRALAEARASLAEVQAGWAALQGRTAAALEGLEAALRPLAGDGRVRWDDAASVAAAAERLLAQHAQWQAAGEAAQQAQGELRAARAEQDRAKGALADHLARCGLDLEARGALPARVEAQARWAALKAQLREDEAALQRLESTLPPGLPDTLEALREREAQLEELTARNAEINGEIARIKARRDELTQGRTVEAALADQAEAFEALRADRDRQLQARVEEALLGELRGGAADDDAPTLLRRAHAWFLRFTRNRHELQVAEDGTFLALDTRTDRRQALSELSDGTRIQLLLAARIAFVEQAEGHGGRTPLFLDEVLSTTDPARFEAAAEAVLDLCGADRQIFYATADPGEVEAWRRVASRRSGGGRVEITTHALGGASVDGAWEAPLAFPEPPRTPAVDGRSAADYARALGLARPRLHDGVDTWPLALVLHDHLGEVQRAAELGFYTLGQLRLADQGVRCPLSPEALAVARARGAQIALTLEALRIGRGAPFTWETVWASEGVTETFRERVQVLYRAHPDDAAAFLEAVAGLSRFRKDRLERLRQALEDCGALDEQPTLSPDAVAAWVAARLAEQPAGEAPSLAELSQLQAYVREAVLKGADA